MMMYFISLAVGLLVGVIYGLLHVRSPAPPVIALIGLFGMLAGEQLPPLMRGLWAGEFSAISSLQQIELQMFGDLPKGGEPDQGEATPSDGASGRSR